MDTLLKEIEKVKGLVGVKAIPINKKVIIIITYLIEIVVIILTIITISVQMRENQMRKIKIIRKFNSFRLAKIMKVKITNQKLLLNLSYEMVIIKTLTRKII